VTGGRQQACIWSASAIPDRSRTFREYPDEVAEATAVAASISRLVEAGTPASEIAVLYRINAQSEAYEEALTEAGIAYQVRGGEGFFSRQGDPPSPAGVTAGGQPRCRRATSRCPR